MSDLIQPQIFDSCKLSIPNGLKDLMADISREVLRAQPLDIHKFIANYLSALLVTRENLTVASCFCVDMYENISGNELIDELKAIGFEDETADKAADVITKFFENGGTREDALLPKLMKIIEIEEDDLADVRTAIENTFIRQQIKNKLNIESDSNDDDNIDEITRAVQNTMKLYEQTEPTEQQYEVMSSKIQAAYKGYWIRSRCSRQSSSIKANDLHTPLNAIDESTSNMHQLRARIKKLSGAGEIKKSYLQKQTEAPNSKIKTAFKSANFELHESKNLRHILISTPEKSDNIDHPPIKEELEGKSDADDVVEDLNKVEETSDGNIEVLSDINNEYECEEIEELIGSADATDVEKRGEDEYNQTDELQNQNDLNMLEEVFDATKIRPLSEASSESSHYLM